MAPLRNLILKERQKPAPLVGKYAKVDESGRLVLPDAVIQRFGLNPGDQLYLEIGTDTLRLHRPMVQPARIYVEATTRCNMDCAMCQRRMWTDAPADMRPEIFERVLEALDGCDPKPSVVFGGFGEPLMHPDLMDFIQACKARGAAVEVITNGLLLNHQRVDRLMDLELDRIWLSMDSVSDQGNGHARDQAAFGRLIDNLKHMMVIKYYAGESRPRLGFVFVAMKENIGEFPEVLRLARSLNVDKVLVSNLLPYTQEGLKQILYSRSTWKMNDRLFQVKLPRMDFHGEAMGIIVQALGHQDMTDLLDREYVDPLDTCPFMKKGSVSVGRDGRVSPCPPLLHTHQCFFQEIQRQNRECSFGSLEERGLLEIWNDASYAAFRRRVVEFDFTPCVSCASCEMAEGNEEDCFGNTFPTCGGCLWAQGLIQCP